MITITVGNIISMALIIISAVIVFYYYDKTEGYKFAFLILIAICLCLLAYDNFEETGRLNSVPDRYETLLAKVESADDMTVDLVREVSDWNTEVKEGREQEKNLINRLLLPVVYDKVDTIDIRLENAEYVK